MLVRLATECGADLLVIGNKGMQRRVLGSVPNTVTQQGAMGSVLVVKDDLRSGSAPDQNPSANLASSDIISSRNSENCPRTVLQNRASVIFTLPLRREILRGRCRDETLERRENS